MYRNISTNEFWDEISKIYIPSEKRILENTNILTEYGDIKISHFNTGSGINYSCFYGTFNQDISIEGKCHNDSSFLKFNTGSVGFLQDTKNSKKIQINKDTSCYGKEYTGYHAKYLYKKNEKHIGHSIQLDDNLLGDLLKNKNSTSISKSNYLSLSFNNNINTHQKTLLNNIFLSKNLTGKIQEIYLESKILDLIYKTINDSNQKTLNNEIYLNSADILSLGKAKKILLDNLSNPPSLKELSRKIATNEFKLKKGFKQLFGNTVYGFVQEKRLIQAKILLEHNDINVSEAAVLVGYKSIGHFSKIFKEKFGYLASDLIKKRKYY